MASVSTALDGTVVEGNNIGTDITGLFARPNGNSGVRIFDGSFNIIGGTTAAARNVISGNSQNGVLIESNLAVGNVVEGNYIGTDMTGLARLSNQQNGIVIDDSPSNVIGNTTGPGNVISGNAQDGVLIQQSNATGNIVEGNFIGTDVTGTAALFNIIDGVGINGASLNFVGGTTAAARNVISGNAQNGINISGSAATGNTVEGNFVGTDVTGLNSRPNIFNGVEISSGSSNIIGGITAGTLNVISGNGQDGVQIFGSSASGNNVLGNHIGTNVSGLLAVPNISVGVEIDLGSSNIIGGTTATARNVISGNGVDGVSINGNSAAGNLVQGNYIGTDLTGGTALGNHRHGVFNLRRLRKHHRRDRDTRGLAAGQRHLRQPRNGRRHQRRGERRRQRQQRHRQPHRP